MPIPTSSPVLIVHGGAWYVAPHQRAAFLTGAQTAARIGHAVLRSGGSALDGVEAAIRSLESDGTFNAGRGSALTRDGTIEMDASVMTDDSNLGAVASVSTVEHAISLARLVHASDHCLIAGEGAERFAKEMGVPKVNAADFASEESLEDWRRHIAERANHSDGENEDAVNVTHVNGTTDRVRVNGGLSSQQNRLTESKAHDTVGAVALDAFGNMACGTSTGGIEYMRAGRVGDSPLVGSGLYCERNVAGVSCTGDGECIMRAVMAKHVTDLMSFTGLDLQNAGRQSVQHMADLTGGMAGLIALDFDGRWTAKFNSSHMTWACVDGDAMLFAGVDTDEVVEGGSVLEDELSQTV